MTTAERLQAVVDRAGRDDQLDVVAAVARPSTGLRWTGTAGGLDPNVELFVASTTKLHTSAMVLRLVERGLVGLDQPMVELIDPARVARLHVIDGVDRTAQVTVRHLMAQTSGLADYFSGRHPDGTLEDQLRSGHDASWTVDDAIERARRIGAAFPPGAGRKALYSDTNYQLLGLVIEAATGRTFADALGHEVVEPLGLVRTRSYAGESDGTPLALRDGPRTLHIPRAMASFGPDGGIVSTADELLAFVRAFFEGGLFDPARLDGLRDYRRIFFPLQYGVGHARFAMPRLLGGVELIGHSGLSGAFAFLAPASGTYVAGTVNNLSRPSRSFQLMVRLVQAARSHAA